MNTKYKYRLTHATGMSRIRLTTRSTSMLHLTAVFSPVAKLDLRLLALLLPALQPVVERLDRGDAPERAEVVRRGEVRVQRGEEVFARAVRAGVVVDNELVEARVVGWVLVVEVGWGAVVGSVVVA